MNRQQMNYVNDRLNRLMRDVGYKANACAPRENNPLEFDMAKELWNAGVIAPIPPFCLNAICDGGCHNPTVKDVLVALHRVSDEEKALVDAYNDEVEQIRRDCVSTEDTLMLGSETAALEALQKLDARVAQLKDMDKKLFKELAEKREAHKKAVIEAFLKKAAEEKRKEKKSK